MRYRLLLACALTWCLNSAGGANAAYRSPIASLSFAVSAPTAPNSTSAFTMQCLAGTTHSITPTVTGNIIISISGTITEGTGTATAGSTGVIFYAAQGTSTPCTTSNGTLAGTQEGPQLQYENGSTVVAANIFRPFSTGPILVTGLTVGTSYWIDLAAKSIGVASGIGFIGVQVTAHEIR